MSRNATVSIHVTIILSFVDCIISSSFSLPPACQGCGLEVAICVGVSGNRTMVGSSFGGNIQGVSKIHLQL
jgi:hypothetical protein